MSIKKIKERSEISKCLEYLFILDAYETCFNKKAGFYLKQDSLSRKWFKYSSEITKCWLNSLDEDQFFLLISRLLKEEVVVNRLKELKEIIK